MPELEDLRSLPLGYRYDVLNRSRIAVDYHSLPVGEIQRTNFWRSRYEANLAGIGWRLHRESKGLRQAIRLSFAAGNLNLAEAVRHGTKYRARVDGTSEYLLLRDEPGRAVWKDHEGFSTVSFQQNANPRMELRRNLAGSIHVFEACHVSHAPVLVLLGLMAIVYDGFFYNRSSGVIEFPGTYSPFDN